jgi:imidazolonepropionase-like amidohydrolase
MKAIVGGRVIDGNGGGPIEEGVVLVDGERIEAVGAADRIAIPEDAERIDAAGKTVMPGVIDGHIHITSMPEFLDRMGHLTQNLQAVRKLHQSLMRGVTTVANMGGCPENVVLRDAIDEGYIHGVSRMLVGAMVNATGGHVRGRTADGPWEVRKAVREMITARTDFIKTAATGGFMWKHEKVEWPDYSLEELEALTSEAHSRDKLVAVHAHSQPGLGQAIEAGCDVIAHGALIDEAALEGIAEKHLFFMPTLYITSHHVINRPNLPEHMKERMSHAHPIHREGVRKAHEMGITICVGTDGGPGDAMVELEELVNCGLSPMDAIVAGTRNAARSIGIIEETGTLEPGKLADVIVVDGDPLKDIAAMKEEENISLVMRRGTVEKQT